MQQKVTADGRTVFTDQTGRSVRDPTNQSLRLGASYALSPTQQLMLTGLLNTTKLRSTEDFATLLTRGTAAPLALRNQNFLDEDLRDTTVRQNYLNLFPSATLTRTLPGEQRLSYSRRLNWPGFLQLMPLAFYSDARNEGHSSSCLGSMFNSYRT